MSNGLCFALAQGTERRLADLHGLMSKCSGKHLPELLRRGPRKETDGSNPDIWIRFVLSQIQDKILDLTSRIATLAGSLHQPIHGVDSVLELGRVRRVSYNLKAGIKSSHRQGPRVQP